MAKKKRQKLIGVNVSQALYDTVFAEADLRGITASALVGQILCEVLGHPKMPAHTYPHSLLYEFVFRELEDHSNEFHVFRKLKKGPTK